MHTRASVCESAERIRPHGKETITRKRMVVEIRCAGMCGLLAWISAALRAESCKSGIPDQWSSIPYSCLRESPTADVSSPCNHLSHPPSPYIPLRAPTAPRARAPATPIVPPPLLLLQRALFLHEDSMATFQD